MLFIQGPYRALSCPTDSGNIGCGNFGKGGIGDGGKVNTTDVVTDGNGDNTGGGGNNNNNGNNGNTGGGDNNTVTDGSGKKMFSIQNEICYYRSKLLIVFTTSLFIDSRDVIETIFNLKQKHPVNQ